LRALQEYRGINLWSVEAELVLAQGLTPRLPFVPILRGGDDEGVIRQALHLLCADERLHELETLLAFFASFVLKTELVAQSMRWDMTVLRESPWYQEAEQRGEQRGIGIGRQEGHQEGHQEGREEGQQAMLRTLEDFLRYRFAQAPPELQVCLSSLRLEQLRALVNVALTAASLDEFAAEVARR